MFSWDFLWFIVLGALKHPLPCENAESARWSSFYIIKFSGQIHVSLLQLKDLYLIFLEQLLKVSFSTGLNHAQNHSKIFLKTPK